MVTALAQLPGWAARMKPAASSVASYGGADGSDDGSTTMSPSVVNAATPRVALSVEVDRLGSDDDEGVAVDRHRLEGVEQDAAGSDVERVVAGHAITSCGGSAARLGSLHRSSSSPIQSSSACPS